MSTNTGGGTTTSLNNTPQAQSDTYLKDEDSLGISYLNVMSNDLGGNAKILWSVDDGSSSLDLVQSDIGIPEATSSDHSAHGAKIWVENGMVGYDGSTLDSSFKTSLQALAVGETTTDTFTYAIRLSNGTLSWNTVTIVYTGTDDAPDISIGSGDSAAACLTETNSPLLAAGTLTVVDPDTSDTDAVAITAFSKSGNAGSLTDAQLQAMLHLASSTLTANSGETHNLGWSFNSGAVNFDYLAAGESLTLTYTVTASDGHGLSDTQTVTITIKGTNDGPELVSGGTLSGGVTEDSGTYGASGSFGFTDVDSSDTHIVSVTPDHANYLGTLTANVANDSTGDGSGAIGWSFTVADADLQFLGEGETRTQTYTVTVDDGHGGTKSETVTVTLTGDEDPVVITSAPQSQSISEDGTSVGGSIAFNDVDLSDTHTASFAANSHNTTTLGTFAIDSAVTEGVNAAAGSLGWTYTVNDAAAQHLAAGETAVEQYDVTFSDGHGGTVTETVTVTITGSNDAPLVVAGGSLSGGVEEDSGTYTAGGSFGFTDVDSSDTHSVSVTPAGSGYLGTLTPIVSDDSTGDGSGTVSWSFSVANGDLQFLGEGETRTQTYTVTVDDGHGGTASETITVVLTGNEDPVIITSGDVAGAVEEDSGTYGDSGSFGFTDADLSDTHSVTATPDGTGYLGTLTPTVSNDSTGDGAGTIGWSFSVDNADLQFLGEGETRTQTYTVTVDDGHGSAPTQTVTVVLTGNEDPVIITSGDVAGAVEEDSGTYGDSGSFGFTDADLSDTHSVTATPDGTGYLGTLTPTVSNDSTGDGAGTIGWSFSVDNADLQFLGEGETRTQTYTVTVDDGHGSAPTQTVTVVLTGNEDPVIITSASQSDSLSEDGTSVGGTIAFTDPDLSDTHSASFVPNSGNTTSLGNFSIDSSVTEAANAADGSLGWSYTVDNAAAQYLAAGESVVEKYDVTFDDHNGSTVTETVSVTITGSNDGPDISAITGDSAGANLDETNAGLSTSGTLTVTDPDTSDTVATSVSNLSVSGNQGLLGQADLLAMFSITGGTDSNLAANTGDTHNLNWSFDSGSEAFDFLAQGQTLTLTYTLTSDDGHGATDSQDVTITITGTNDAPVLSATLTSTTYTDTAADDSFGAVSGTLTTADPDSGDTATYSIDGGSSDNSLAGYDTSASSAYGTLYLNSSTGAYTFIPDDNAIEALKDSHSVDFTLTVTDSQAATGSQTLTINVEGANDTPELSATLTAATFTDTAADDSFSAITGNLSSTDRDNPDTATYGVLGGVSDSSLSGYDTSKATAFGTLYVDSASGNYTFIPDDAAIEGLKSGTTLFFTLNVTDGSSATDTKTLTINLDGVNDTPVLGAVTDASYNDTAANDVFTDVTGTLTSTDRDAGDSKSFSVAGATTTSEAGFDQQVVTTYGTLYLNGSTGEYKFVANDGAIEGLKTTDHVDFAVTVTDGSSATDSDTLTITFNGVNDTPEAPATNSVTTDEDTASLATAIGASDRDAGEVLTYSIKAGGEPSIGSVSFDQTHGTFTYTPDANANGADSFTILVTDASGATTEQVVNVTVTPVNDAPVITSEGGGDTASVNAAENSIAVTTVTATDIDSPTITFSIAGGDDAALFHIDPSTGVLTFVAAPDFENPADADGDNVYSLVVQASDGSLTDTQAISVTVTNVNEAPAITSDGGGATASLSIAENATAVTTVTAADPDAGTTLIYSIAGGADQALFTIDAQTGALSFLAAPDFENPSDAGGDNVYDVTVRASDGSLADDQAISVTVTNENDNPPVITSNGGGDSAGVSVAENSSVVTTVTAMDADGDTVTYSVSGGADAAKFSIDATTGALTFAAAPDFENPQDSGANNVYDVEVTASDGTHVDTQAIAVTVTNVNDNPPVITSNGGGNSASVSVAENATAVTTVAATDADGDTLTYSISGGADAAKFSIDATTGALTFAAAPDFENPQDAGGNNVYDVEVTASDGTHVDTQSLAVTVTNQNDNAPVITSDGAGASASVSVTESSSPVTTVTATDADGDGVTFSITGGADSAKFQIDATTGALSFIAAPNFESPQDAGANNVYDVQVTASDGTHVDTQAIAVTVTNVNEAPAITSNGGGASASVNVPENSTAVTTVSATDPDAGTTISYSIAGGADAAKFSINATTGALSFVAAPDFEHPTDSGANNIYDVVVQASDGSLVDTQAIAVTVTDTSENIAPTANADVLWVTNNTTVNLPLSVLMANDVDPDGVAETITGITVTSGSLAGPVTINSDGTFSFATGAAGGIVGSPTVVTLSYTTSDGAGGTSTGSVTVNVVTGGAGSQTINLSTAPAYQASFLDGGANNDNLTDGSPSSVLIGGAGNTDILIGGAGNDILRGGLGNNDSVDGGAGEDLIDFSDGTVGIGTSANPFVFTQSTTTFVLLPNNFAGLGNNDQYMNVEGIIGTNLADFITGSAANDIFRGGAGNDTLNGAGGIDLIDFRDGTAGITFALSQGAAPVSFNASAAGLGTDTYSNMEGVIGTGFADTLTGSAFNDILRGEAGNDTLNGLAGDDTLNGGPGADTLTGGPGNDTFVMGPALNNVDTITDYSNVSGNADVIDITQILNAPLGTNVVADGFVRVTTTGLVQVDTNGGGDNWITIANVNASGSYVFQYLLNGATTTVTVGPVAPPIGIDLNGDGHVSFLGTDAGVTFDYGYGRVGTAWVGPQDGIFVNDANHDGQATANEIVFATGGSDLQGLAQYDSNHDGQLSAADSAFSQFAVWQDANSNGVVDAGEMKGLTALGITGISLSSDGVSYSAAGGDVSVVGTGSFTRADGTTGVLADAVFATGSRGADEQVRYSSVLNSNVALLGAVAAAGLAAMPAHATSRDAGDLHDQVLHASEATLATPLATQSVEQDHALSNETAVPLETAAVAQTAHASSSSTPAPDGHATALQVDQAAQPPAELLQATDQPHSSPADVSSTFGAVSPVSAEMLQAAMAGVAQHAAERPVAAVGDAAHATAELGQVLADALAGGSNARADIDSLLDAAAGQGNGHLQVAHNLTMGAPGTAETFGFGHLPMHTPILETMALHPAAPPPA